MSNLLDHTSPCPGLLGAKHNFQPYGFDGCVFVDQCINCKQWSYDGNWKFKPQTPIFKSYADLERYLMNIATENRQKLAAENHGK